mgnify:CR=1 FL=1|tara:strand:- start:1479 stop:2687 length:1209 start_codon:yes stop_codon:yes gene_type:complete
MSIFGGNLINFLGGVAEGASKEIARQQANMDDIVKTASTVIINDRLATRKRKQKRMMELGTQYDFLKNKGLDSRSIKLVLEQGLFEDIVTLSKKRNMTPEKLKSSINIVSGNDIPIDKSSLLNYLTKDIIDADLTNLSVTSGVDTMGALGIKRPLGQQIATRVGVIAPSKATDVDPKISGVTGGLSERAKMLLDKSSKMSTAAFRRLATQVLVERAGGKVNFVPNDSGGYTLRTQGIQQGDVVKAQQRASDLSQQYNKIVFEEGGVSSLNGFRVMSSPEAVDYLLFPTNSVVKEFTPSLNNKNTQTLKGLEKKRIAPNVSDKPTFSTLSLGNVGNTQTFSQEMKSLKEQGIGIFPPASKANYIIKLAMKIQQDKNLPTMKDAYPEAVTEIRKILTENGFTGN